MSTTRHSMASREAMQARGGVAAGPILTGVVVALGALALLTAIISGIMAATGTETTQITEPSTIEVGLGIGAAFVLAQLLAYMWGGYTAGRMARGAGSTNGLLVPIVALLLMAAAAGIATLLGAQANVNMPFTLTRMPVEEDLLVDWGTGIAIAGLIAMLLGGLMGGMAGARWHSKLEQRTLEEQPPEQRREIRLDKEEAAKESPPPPVPAGGTAVGGRAGAPAPPENR